jgi:type VI secretion system protein ImpF
MADHSLKEKLLPSLLDRLTDEAPHEKRESRQSRIQSLKNHRADVLRDLESLMNTENLESVNDLESHPNVADSVLNFGMPCLAGLTLSAVDVDAIETRIGKAIASFEPRILKDTLRVEAAYSEASGSNSLTFEIKGDLWAMPVPLKVFLRTELDLETGNITVNPISEN